MEQNAHDYLTVPADIGDGVELHAIFQLLPQITLPQKFEVEPFIGELSKLLEWKNNNHLTASFLEEKLPALSNSLSSIAKINSQTKIEIIYLAPGLEKIIPANNGRQNDININIVIQMPEAAKLYVDTNIDGGCHAYTQCLSLKSGDCFLFNTGAHSKWENFSEKVIVILRLLALPQISKEEILSMAKAQNKISSHRDVINMLAAKKSFLGMHTSDNHIFYKELINWGISPQVFPPFVSLGLFTEWLEDPLLQEEALQISKASLVLDQEAFPANFIDSWILKKKQEGKKFVILVASGTYIQNIELFLLESIRLMGEMQRDKIPVMAHLMNKKGKLPFMHEQFFILNLELMEVSDLKFGLPREKYEMTFPAYKASQEQIHDDYTPLWIESTPNEKTIQGQGAFGTEFLAKTLQKKLMVKNIPNSLRQWKKFIYPSEGRGEEYLSVRKIIDNTWVSAKEKVYVFNTEQLSLREYNIRPDIFLFPCAGMKPISLYQQFQGMARNAKCVFVEKNIEAISFYEKLLSCTNIEEIEEYLFQELKKQNSLPESGMLYVKNMIKNILHESFSGNSELFIQNLKAISGRAKFMHLDYFRDQDKLLSLFTLDQSALFWHSNAWKSHQAYFRMSAAELRKNYFNFVGMISKKMLKKAWIHKNAFDAVLGNNFAEPQIVLSSGGAIKKAPNASAFDPYIPPISYL